MRNRRDRQQRQLALIDEALVAGRSVVVDNVNATVADRAALIQAGRRRRAGVVGYVFTTDVAECGRRNRGRVGRERVPGVAILAAAKRFQRPTHAEGFDRLERVRAEVDRFELMPYDGGDDAAGGVFLLSPPPTGGGGGTPPLNHPPSLPPAPAPRRAPRARAG